MVPVDHLLLTEAEALPAIVVVRLPNGTTHFEVVWRRHGKLLQCMDPSTGRRWITCETFLREVYVHRTRVPVQAWREWAGTPAAQAAFRRRLQNLGVSGKKLLRVALTDPNWRSLAQLDAATRLVQSILEGGGVGPGRRCRKLIDRFCEDDSKIPADYWSVLPTETEEELQLKGAVLLHVRGRLSKASLSPSSGTGDISPEIAAALNETPSRPGRELLRLLRADGMLSPALLLFTSLLAAGGVILEAILFRGLFDLSRELGLSGQRMAAAGALLLFLFTLLVMELPVTASLLRMGRRLETRLRQAFLEKIPRLSDRYFQSRLMSDMTERSHMIHRIRHLPDLGGQMIRAALELVLTAAGIAWLDPRLAPLAAVAALSALLLPLLAQPTVIERDLRVRTHSGALSRYYLDALLGLVPIQVHGAQRAVRREHRELLTGWASAGLGLQTVAVWFEAAQFTLGFGLAAAMLFLHLARSAEAGAVLLLIYWALNLPVLGQQIAQIAWQYPAYRNRTLRLLEPLGALEEEQPISLADVAEDERAPVSIHFDNVTMRAAGHTILRNITTDIPAGSHVAIVGPSGAGKSSLVGLMLGWSRPAHGEIRVDGRPVGQCLESLRRHTAWVDPAVQLWNRSFLENIRYGSPVGHADEKAASMLQVLVSGGEGQRVRLARAFLRPGTRLAILDEPFRGLDREQRHKLLGRVRALWKDVTLLCITHDVSETLGFERVLVIEDGALLEDGAPAVLASEPGSRYRAMFEAELALQETMWSGVWSGNEWRRYRMDEATLTDSRTGPVTSERPA